MKKVPISGTQTIELPARHNQPQRSAKLEIRYSEVTVKAPQRSPEAKEKKLSSLKLFVVWLYEIDPPLGIEPLEWMLLTNILVGSLADAIQVERV